MKQCSKCGEYKPLELFHSRKGSSDGRMSCCKDCNNLSKREAYAKNPAAKIAKTRQYHLDHPEWSKATLREWHVTNRDARYEAVKKRLATDTEFREYRRGIVARKERERRAQKANTEFTKISSAEYESILEEFNNTCWICELPLKKVFWDHVQPLAKGGPHTVDNLRPACNPCNIRKNAIWPFTKEMQDRIAKEVRNLQTIEEVML